MRPYAPIVASVAMIVSFAGVASAASGSVLLRFDSPGTLTALVLGTVDGSDAQNMRNQIDQSGNQDGQVSAAEVNSFEQTIQGFFSQFGNDPNKSSSSTGGSFTIDGKGPNKLELVEFKVEKAEGPVTQTDPIDVHMTMRVLFPVDLAPRHNVHFEGSSNQSDHQGDNGPYNFDLQSATLRAPPDFGIESATGLPSGASISSDRRFINFGSAFQNTGDVDIVFARGAAKGPGLPVSLELVGLLAVLVILARRKRDPHA